VSGGLTEINKPTHLANTQNRSTEEEEQKKKEGERDLAEIGGSDAGEVEPARAARAGEYGCSDEDEHRHRAVRRHG